MSLVARNALIAFLLTVVIIGTVAYSVNYLNKTRIEELNALQSQLSIDSLSLETQFSLLESAPCAETVSNTDQTSTDLTSKLDDLGRRLSYEQDQLGPDNAEVVTLKQQYSLLEIRDYLITQKIAQACGTTSGTKPVVVLYFYSNDNDCADCDAAGNALSYLHDTYPNVRVYSFDYNLQLGALATFIKVNNVKDELPAIVINGTPHYGFTSLEDLEKEFPKGALVSTSTATSTKK